MKKLLIGIALLSAVGCSANINTLNDQFIPTTSYEVTSDMVKDAIMKGSSKRGWTPRFIKEGVIEAQLSVRKHMVTVIITYDTDSYSISYKDSVNMKYNKARGTIHNKYNGWVMKLSRTIQSQFGVNSQVY